MDAARLHQLVRQHAETARLLGVDFVPAFISTPPGVDEPEQPQRATAGVGEPVHVEHVLTPPETPSAPAEPMPRSASKAKTPNLPMGAFAPGDGPSPKTRDEKAAALAALEQRYRDDAPHRDFVTEFTNIVFGDGDPAASLFFVGEAPGEEEDKQGKPFVGRSGALLNKIIGAMGLSRESVYIANVLKTRPIDNATPTPREAAACEPYLLEQLRIVSPKAIVTLGLPAARLLLKTSSNMSEMRGRWTSITLANGVKIPVMPTYHPAYLLRSYTPENRRKVWEDMRLVMEELGLQPSPEGDASAG